MEMKIIANLYHFDCADFTADGKINTIKVKDQFVVSRDSAMREQQFIDKDFFYAIGNFNVTMLRDHDTYVAVFVNITEENSKPELANISDIILSSVNGFVYNLWFIKDNSVKFSDIFVVLTEMSENENGYMHSTNKEDIVNAHGQNILVSFSSKELEFVTVISEKINEIRIKRNSDFSVREEYKELEHKNFIHTVANIPHPTDYNEYNVIERALNFLRTARGISHLPYRIASYVPILETLFGCGNSTEITYRISLRVAFYIGIDKNDRSDIIELIKRVYNIRSRYFHGDVLDKKDNDIQTQKELSENMDNLLRKILVKIILSDAQIFLETSKSLETYFSNLILNQ